MTKKLFALIGLMIILIACSRKSEITKSNQDILVDKNWKTYDYKKNGTTDAAVIAQQPTFNFRSDSKLYFSQINPVFRDTLNYQYIDANNIKLTKPWVSATYYANIRIDRLTDYDFDFTATDNQTSDLDTYKTTKQ